MLDVPTDREGYVDKAPAGAARLRRRRVADDRGDRQGARASSSRSGAAVSAPARASPISSCRSCSSGQRYADRLPIGLPETLKSFPPERVRDFYRTWYRADRMAVVVSGDVPVDEAERLVRSRFADLPTPAAPAPAVNTAVPVHAETLVKMVVDSEAQGWNVTAAFKHAPEDRGHRRRLPPIAGALPGPADAQRAAGRGGARSEGAVPGRQRRRVVDRPPPVALRVERRRGRRRHRRRARGGGPRGAARAAVRLRRRRARPRPTSAPGRLRARLQRAQHRREPEPGQRAGAPLPGGRAGAGHRLRVRSGQAVRARHHRRGSHDAHAAAGARRQPGGARGRAGHARHHRADRRHAEDGAGGGLRGAGHGLDRRPGRAGAGGRSAGQGHRDRPAAGSGGRGDGAHVVERHGGVAQAHRLQERPGGVHRLRLRRRVARVRRPTIPDAALLPALVEVGGLGGLTPVDLEKVLAGRIASASVDMDSYTHGVSGSATPKDLETALQLAYLHFTAPGPDRRRPRPAQAPLRRHAGQPAAEPALRVQREGARGHDLGALLGPWAHAGDGREPRPRGDAPDPPRALRQRRRLHVLHRRGLHRGRRRPDGGAVAGVAAVQRPASHRLPRHEARVPGRRASGRGGEGQGTGQPDGDVVLRRHRS